MTHLIFTSVPLEEIPEPDRTSFVNAVENWGRNHIGTPESDPTPNSVVREIMDGKGHKCLEWRRIYGRMLQRPKPIGHCDPLSYASATTPWFAYVRSVSVGTDIPFRKNDVVRYDVYDGELDCRITEEQFGRLNRLTLYFVTKAKTTFDWQVRLGMLDDRAVPFLETAAIYNLADQAVKLALGDTPSIDKEKAVLKKLNRIKRICNLEEFDPRVKRQIDEE